MTYAFVILFSLVLSIAESLYEYRKNYRKLREMSKLDVEGGVGQ
jgi:hypothetical protein